MPEASTAALVSGPTLPRVFLRDPVIRFILGLYALVLLPYFVPVLSDDQLVWYGDLLGDIPLLLLAIGVAFGTVSASEDRRERRFWLCWMLALWMWISVRALLVFAPESWWGHAMDLVTDLLYMLFYSFIVLSLEIGVGIVSPGSAGRQAPRISDVGVVASLLILITYFILIPSSLAPEVYQTYVPSALLFVVLDCYLISKLVVFVGRAETRRWRTTYSLLLITAVLWVLTDAIEALQYIEVIPELGVGSVWDLPWFLPYLPLLLALRSPALVKDHEAMRPFIEKEGVLASSIVWGGSLLLFAFFLPLMHLGLYGLGWLAPEIRDTRDWLVLVGLAVFAALALQYQRVLVKENLKLEADRKLERERDWLVRMDAVQRLAQGVTHDLDNAIAVIDAAGQAAAASESLPERIRSLLEQVVAGTERARTLNEQLKSIGGRASERAEPIDVKDCLLRLLPHLQGILGPDVELLLNVAEAPGSVRVAGPQLEQVLANLAINAKHAMEGKGRLEVALDTVTLGAGDPRLAVDQRAGRFARITFADDGVGIEPDVIDHVFEPYFTTKPEGQGTGLGLATAHSTVRGAGGVIVASSQPGRGSRFEVYLPVNGAGIPTGTPASDPSR